MDSTLLAKLLIVTGAILIIAGVAVIAGARFGFLGLGRLPGDIRIEGDNVRVYIPIATSILLSIVLTVILFLVSRFR